MEKERTALPKGGWFLFKPNADVQPKKQKKPPMVDAKSPKKSHGQVRGLGLLSLSGHHASRCEAAQCSSEEPASAEVVFCFLDFLVRFVHPFFG